MSKAFSNTFTSFIGIEIFIISILLFVVCFINIKVDKKFVKYEILIIILGGFLALFGSSASYISYSFDTLIKRIMNYIYFPSTVIYFFIMVFVTIDLVYTLFSKKMQRVKKIVNYAVFSIFYFFFSNFVFTAYYKNLDLADKVSLYTNKTVLAVVQISNLLIFIYIIFTIFYYLYLYFKKKYDKDSTSK
jgi:hypothetical protein